MRKRKRKKLDVEILPLLYQRRVGVFDAEVEGLRAFKF